MTTQFILEVLVLTLLVLAGGYLTGSPVNPILFLAFIYLFTMRSRLLVDLAILLSNRGRQRDAISLLQVALSLFPDQPARLIILVNMGIVQLRRKNPESARELLESALEEAAEGGLGIRYRAGCHYNLGVALQQLGNDAQAVRHFRETTKVFPGSPFSRAAEQALEKRKRDKKSTK